MDDGALALRLDPAATEFGRDPLGLPVTVDGAAAQQGIDAFVSGFLSYDRAAAEVLAFADAAPRGCLVNAYAAALWLLLEAHEGPKRAQPYLQRAEAAAPEATARERALVAFVRAWSSDDLPEAFEIGEANLAAHPRDLIQLKLLQYHYFNLGRFADLLRVAQVSRPAAGDIAFTHGMLAFGYEQCHLLDRAEASAREALRLRRREPWAQHALAHVMLTQGRIDEGAAFMEAHQDTWTDLNSFMDTHLWWHLALFRLSQGRLEEARAIYDDHAWAVSKDYSQDQVGAVSLLARLELAGVEVGDRWADLGDHLAGREADVGQPFLTLQYLYGLARAGRPEAERLLQAVRTRGEDAPEYIRETWTEIAAPLAEGLIAHARGDWESAARRLTPALPRLQDIGGSHAQRDLFEQILLDSVVRSGRLDRAQQMLECRRAHDPEGVPLNRLLAQVYHGLHLAEEAEACDARVATRMGEAAA